jgi:hypothetical protein
MPRGGAIIFSFRRPIEQGGRDAKRIDWRLLRFLIKGRGNLRKQYRTCRAIDFAV